MENLKPKKITAVWIIAVLGLFVFAIVLGILMRLTQGEVLAQVPGTFYANMTTHGLTMIGIWFVAGMAAVHFLMQRYVPVGPKANVTALVFTVVGILMLFASTFIGKFATGWTFLYPLPLRVMWEPWATPVFLATLTVLGVGWLIWSLSMMAALLKKYSLRQAFAWQHFRGTPDVETPPFILITMVTLVGIVTSLLAAVLLLVLFFVEMFSAGAFVNDALLMKNLTYFFGHTIANEMLYLGLAVIYELFGEVSGSSKWKTAWYVAVAWNCTLVFILTAFFHHLYMDFVQAEVFQIIGQVASYLASIPAAAVTVFSVIVAVYKKPIQWSLTNVLFFMGIAGWVIGGVGAVIDATITNNFVLHNTLWVPAHFHTYNAMGNVLFSLGFFTWFANGATRSIVGRGVSRMIITTLLVGGIGFLAAFYVAGADSIPRRYSTYPEAMTWGAPLATIAAVFATIYLIGILVFLWDIGRKSFSVLFSDS